MAVAVGFVAIAVCVTVMLTTKHHNTASLAAINLVSTVVLVVVAGAGLAKRRTTA